jgi:ABC-type Co2+ transport system permease subunit
MMISRAVDAALEEIAMLQVAEVALATTVEITVILVALLNEQVDVPLTQFVETPVMTIATESPLVPVDGIIDRLMVAAN